MRFLNIFVFQGGIFNYFILELNMEKFQKD